MTNEIVNAAGLSDLLRQAPPGCVLYWARGVVVGSGIEGKEEQYPFRRVEVANVDERLKHYDLCIENANADYANGDPVSIFGHAVEGSPVAPFPRIMLNHNTGKWFPVVPLPHEGGFDMTQRQYKDWLQYTGKPDIFNGGPGGVFARNNPNKGGHQIVREGITPQMLGFSLAMGFGFILAPIGAIALLVTHPGLFFLLLIAGVGFFIWRKKNTPPKVNLAPIYQEMVMRTQTFALNNPDPDSMWEARPRY